MLGGTGRGVLTERGETDTSCCHDNSCNLRLQLVASKVLQRGGGGGGGEEEEEEEKRRRRSRVRNTNLRQFNDSSRILRKKELN